MDGHHLQKIISAKLINSHQKNNRNYKQQGESHTQSSNGREAWRTPFPPAQGAKPWQPTRQKQDAISKNAAAAAVAGQQPEPSKLHSRTLRPSSPELYVMQPDKNNSVRLRHCYEAIIRLDMQKCGKIKLCIDAMTINDVAIL